MKHFIKEIKNRIPIHVDLGSTRDEVYSGICLKSNDNIFIFVCFNEEKKEFDGFAIIRSQEITQYREWDKEELSEIENNNFSNFINILPLDRMDNMFNCLKQLKNEKLIAIFDEFDNESYFVGEIKNLTENTVELTLLNEDAEWIDNQKVEINKITYIGFQTSYEKELLNKNATE